MFFVFPGRKLSGVKRAACPLLTSLAKKQPFFLRSVPFSANRPESVQQLSRLDNKLSGVHRLS
jgi:hypothetical protein